ncbi:MAG: metallophosphoesterase [Acidobacteria bacterium]|nr:metallophosphoesterase [Acidobacteriota bacterium]MCA1648869.1 metallophosphoesterase [Acidobacteriota bacterium]
MGQAGSPGAGGSAASGRFGALGDLHGNFERARRIVRQHPDVPFWLCVGDLADADGRYEAVDTPLYWIKGNNENFDTIAAGALPAGLHYVPNAQEIDVGEIRVAGLGGTLAPTWYETPAADLPHPRKGTVRATELADKRRHFVREEVDACKRMRGIDVFLTHEAARPYRAGRGNDAGKTPINEVLVSMQPRLHLFGHHHRFTEQEREGVRSIGLDLVSESYLLIDAPTLEYHLMS